MASLEIPSPPTMTNQESEAQNVPWQFEWKRPQWHESEDVDQAFSEVEGTCLGMVSAAIDAEEVPADYKTTEDENSVFLLAVTVVSSPFCVDTPGCGDLLVLEILRQAGPDAMEEAKEQEAGNKNKLERLLMKVLRWPGVALQKDPKTDMNREGRKNWRHNLPGWLGGIPEDQHPQREKTVGVVAACLSRRQVGDNEKQKAAVLEALDTMTFLSLGMDPEVQTTRVTTEDDNTSSRSTNENHPMPELLLACLCNDGHVHIYSPWKLLQLSKPSMESNEGGDVFGNSMSSFLLGDYVFEQLQSSIWPLSQPEESIHLTVPMPKPGKPTEADPIHFDENATDGESPGLSLWDRSVWDPQVDPFTAIYRTVDNVPTHCISAFEYVVIAGRGRRAGVKPSVGPQGGFLTVMSLQQLAEVRTLFLPYVPATISPFVWGGMQFLFVIGKQGVAVAIRIDISVYNSVIVGQAPSLATAMQDPNDPIIPTVSSEQSLVSYQSNSSQKHNNDRNKPKLARCFLHRFQILPIQLPETISDETEALSIAKTALFGSSPLISPPAMVAVSENSGRQILVVQSKLESVNLVRHSTSHTHQLFRQYRRSRSRKMLVIETSQEPRHVARIRKLSSSNTNVDKNQRRGDGIWCHPGQVCLGRNLLLCFAIGTAYRIVVCH